MFELRDQFDALASPKCCRSANRIRRVYLNCAASLGVSPMNCVALEELGQRQRLPAKQRGCGLSWYRSENSRDPRFVLADVKLATLESLTPGDLLG